MLLCFVTVLTRFHIEQDGNYWIFLSLPVSYLVDFQDERAVLPLLRLLKMSAYALPPPLRAPEGVVPYPQEFDTLSTEERNYLYGEDEILEPDFWAATAQSGAEDRLELNVDRQTVAQSRPLDLRLVVGVALVFGAVLILALPQQRLQNHPRCGITTGGKVGTMI